MEEFTPCKVFVYGTLKRGYSNHRILGDSILISDGCWIREDDGYRLYNGSGFPYMLYSLDWFVEGNEHEDDEEVEDLSTIIVGEVYEVRSQQVLDALDMLEGVPHHYTRKLVEAHYWPVENGNIRHEEAFIYVASPSTAKQVMKTRTLVPAEWGEVNWTGGKND